MYTGGVRSLEDLPAADLPAADLPSRLGRLRERLVPENLDALVITGLANVAYLSAFTGSAGMLFVLPEETVLVTDGRYVSQAEQQLRDASVSARVELAPPARAGEVCSSLVRSARVRRLGAEAAHLSWARQRAFASEWFEGIDLVPTEGLVEGLRRVKDRGEIARIGAAGAIADQALASLGCCLDNESGPGASAWTEQHFASALDAEMRRLGSPAAAFETIVASGPNSALPHHRPSHRVMGAGEPIVVDFGARFEGYCSDMTRTLWYGDLSDPTISRIYAVVAESQQAGLAAVRDGVSAAEVDRSCRSVIEEAGYGDNFVHGTGHGVGLEIHEAPWLGPSSNDVLEADQVVTVEPGIYVGGVGGVRIEDAVVVTRDGYRPLTLSPKRA